MLPFIIEERTVWERLAEAQKPIVLYGMGLGAEKILRIMKTCHVTVSDVFASDDFVRGQSFYGWQVKTLAEVQARYDDFIIVVAFAFWQDELLRRVETLSKRYELYAPHVPVVGTEAVDSSYLDRHETEIQAAYRLMADEQSRRVYASIWNYKLSGKILYIREVTTPKEEAYALIRPSADDVYLDLGAYDGDTIREMTAYAGGSLRRVIALEPDPKNFRKLSAFAETYSGDLHLINAGVYDRDTSITFANKAGRHSAVSRDGKGIKAPMRSIDSVAGEEPVTIIKMDVEGEEAKALAGGKTVLRRDCPRLIVSAYHRNEDTFALPLQIHALNPGYRIYLRQHPYIPAWDNNLYAVKEGFA